MKVRNIKRLAELTGLCHDGDDMDNRLFTECCSAETLHLTKREYNAMQKKIDSFTVSGKGFQVAAWNDSSGYEYWTKNMGESNYIQITVYIETDNALTIDLKELERAIDKVEWEFDDYRDCNFHEPHCFPSDTVFFNLDANIEKLATIKD